MGLLIKILLLLINIALGILFFKAGWISTAIFLVLTFFYQLYLYGSLKKIGNYSYFNRRVRVMSLVMHFILIAIVSRMINLQIVNGNYYREKEYEQISSDLVKKGDRGVIYDANMKKIAFNTNTYNLIVDPQRADGDEKTYKILNELFKKGIIKDNSKKIKEELEKLAVKGSRYKVIGKQLDESEKAVVEEILKENGMKKNQFFFEKILVRKYYKTSEYQTIVGNIGYPKNEKGFRKIGVFGVERFYERYLKEKELKIKAIFTKSRDIKLPTSKETLDKSLDGKDVILTLDIDINSVLTTELGKQYEKFNAEEAYALVMDPNTGRVLATSYFSKHAKSLRNPLFQDQFEPGSIFKPLVIAAALEEKYITTNTKIDVGDGTLKRHNHTIKEASRGTRGVLTPGEIINKSSNVGMSLISEKFTNEKFEEYLKKYGLYDRTGIDFPGELKPFATPYKKWDKLKKYTMSFGQGIVTTPIQLATAFSATINGGILYKPYIVDRVQDKEGVVVMRNTPKEIERVISPETSEIIKKMMEDNVTDGSGKRAIVSGYRIGGKTGTAQISGPRGGYLKGEYLSSFVGVFPIEKPEYVVLIMILKPQSDSIYGRYGSSVAAPVFGEVVAGITKIKGMASQDVKKITSSNGEAQSTELKIQNSSEEKDKVKNGIMPNLKGKNQKDLLEIFSGTRFNLDIKGDGVVKTQVPQPDSNLGDIDEIKIVLSER